MTESQQKCGKQAEGSLKWWQLSLIGVGCIIGTGFFLGSSLAIKHAGPAVMLSFFIAAVTTYIVFRALAKMISEDPQKGAFCTYASKAFGPAAGFTSGWVYWLSEILIMGSQLTALSIFSKFWFPAVPLWIFACIFALLGVGVVLAGTKGFERLENVFASIKIGAILMFIILAVLAIFGVFKNGPEKHEFPSSLGGFFPEGIMGLWLSLIYAFYAFGGIEVMGLMAMDLKDKKDAPKSGSVMLMVLGVIYIASMVFAVTLLSWQSFNQKESPFVLALEAFKLPVFPHVFNGALIIAGFSTMCASLFAVTNLLVTLAENKNAPRFFQKKTEGKRKLPIRSLCLTISGMAVSIVLSLFMPGKIYEYITTAAGLMLLYNWIFILFSSKKLTKTAVSGKLFTYLGAAFITLAIIGTAFNQDSRPGFFASLALLILIVLLSLKLKASEKKEKGLHGKVRTE
ncbi:amino acid permease [Metabacillus sp. GX 13764]|uniref:amino acid permease n=1 Tax=Metabacillus kandeliae TaxID=2900151 RepID=UPI001E32C0C2|nr:amino acid permease [Metabacillus kandeliae]